MPRVASRPPDSSHPGLMPGRGPPLITGSLPITSTAGLKTHNSTPYRYHNEVLRCIILLTHPSGPHTHTPDILLLLVVLLLLHLFLLQQLLSTLLLLLFRLLPLQLLLYYYHYYFYCYNYFTTTTTTPNLSLPRPPAEQKQLFLYLAGRQQFLFRMPMHKWDFWWWVSYDPGQPHEWTKHRIRVRCRWGASLNEQWRAYRRGIRRYKRMYPRSIHRPPRWDWPQ
jgi:hypothetical protein